jgi:hypothetical protein
MTITDKQAYQITGGTTLTGTVMAAAGDRVIASVVTRDTFTAPVGWTTLYESGIYDSTQGNGQRAFALCKVIDTAGTVSFTATQASSQRLYLNLISISGCGNVEAYTSLCKTESGASISAGNKNSGEAIIWALSSAYWTLTSPYAQWATSPSDLALLDLGTSVQSRLGNFIDLGSGTATGRTFTQPTGNSNPINVIAIRLYDKSYKSSGNAIFTVAGITATVTASSISWSESKPTGTTLTVSVSTDGTNFSAVTNSGALLAADTILDNATIYIKVEMSTTDTATTPTLSDLYISLQSVDDTYSIVLEMEPLQRFESAAGNITVAYDGNGTLQGAGGPVAAFEQSFAPTDLIPKPDQNDQEHINIASISAASNLMRVYYTNAYGNEHINIASITAVGTLTNINDL